MRRHGALALVVISCFCTTGVRGAVPPAAPIPLGPANGASLTTPFAISWSAVSDPAGINGYNWQLGTSSSFATLVKADSTAATQDIVSGVPVGATYFWRVQAVNGAGEASAWSAPRSVTVTGTAAGTPAAPVANPTTGYSTLHPWEFVQFTWSAVPGAAEYFHVVSNDPGFPIGQTAPGVITFSTDNITSTSTGFVHAVGEGTWYARVYAVSADGVLSLPSNTISYTVFFNNPVPAPPVLISPVGNPVTTLPFSLRWNHVANPQSMGYEVQVSTNAQFTNNETPLGVQLTNPEFVIRTLTAGQKFWRVRSHHGLRSQNADGTTTNAVTNWSATGTFTMTTAPATVVSVTPVRNPLYSGDDTFVDVQLTVGAPAGGATVQLSSSHPALAPVPAALGFPATWGLNSFQMVAGQVVAPTVVTLRGTLNGVQTPTQFTLRPPELRSIEVSGGPNVTGGMPLGAIVSLHGRAPAGGATINFASSSPAVDPPPAITIAPGDCCIAVSMNTAAVTSVTPATITATWNGVSQQALVSVKPPPTPSAIMLTPATVVGGESSVQGVITVTATADHDRYMQVASNHPAVPGTVAYVPAFDNRGLFMLLPNAVSQQAVATISASGGGVTRSATLTINPSGTPPPGPELSSFTVSPASVSGGTQATGIVRLPSAAPSGGAVVALASNQPGAASVPQSVTVPSGSIQASFAIATFPNAGTTAQLSARRGDTILFSSIFVGPAAASNVTVTLTVSGRRGERVTSNPAGLTVSVGGSRSAPFASGRSITLTVSNGREAVFSGACSSGGRKRTSCTFTPAANASVTANVQ